MSPGLGEGRDGSDAAVSIVEDQERRCAVTEVEPKLLRGLVSGEGVPCRLGDRHDHLLLVSRLGEIDGDRAARPERRAHASEVMGEPGLADATGTDEGHQRRRGQALPERHQLGAASDERVRRVHPLQVPPNCASGAVMD